MSQPQKDRPWLIRTYAGHSTAAASNALYRATLARGQTDRTGIVAAIAPQPLVQRRDDA